MTLSIRLNDDDTMLIKKYAQLNNTSVSEFVRRAVIERIEDEYDLKCYYEAIEEFKKNPVTYTHEQIREMLEIDDEV
jgi:stalled ribosome rescue protein Dom34